MKRRRRVNRTPRPAGELIDLTVVLLSVQGVIGAVATFEIAVVAAATGGVMLPAVVLTAVGTGLTFWAGRGLRRRSRRARTTAVVVQVLWLVVAALDLLLAAVLARRGLELVPTLTRIVLPYAIFRILRRPQVRTALGAKPSWRRRRHARAATRSELPVTPAEQVPA